jgi:hypothetical protein
VFLDPQGNIISSIFTLPVGYAGRFRVSAGKTRFMLAWEEWSAQGAGLRDVHYRIVDAFGSIIGAGQANEVTLSAMWDEVGVACQGNIHDTFVVSWVRHSPAPGVPTLGVFFRRVDANGALMEPVPTRVDIQSSNFGLQHSTACTIWPSGRILVVWIDGAPGVPSGGPDGDGTGITARWFNADTTPATSAGLPAGSLLGDQTEPRLSANHRTEAVLAYMSNAGGFLDVCVNRVTDAGQVYDLTPLNLTAGTVGNHVLGGIGMAPNGDHVVSWLDSPPIPGGAGGRVAYARLSSPWAFSTGGLVQQGFMEPATGSSETQGLPALTVDLFGNFTGIWPRESAGQWDLRRQVFKRNMITFSNPNPPIGSFVSMFLDSPSDPGHSYFLAR